MNRREFIASLGALGALSASGCSAGTIAATPPGNFVGADAERGHMLRSGNFPPASETRKHSVIIIGGGIAGLSAAWRLQRGGCKDFGLYELEDSVGGNSRWGESSVTRYPLGAHYLPLPPREARAVRTLLSDLDVLQGDPLALQPQYDERFLCFAPQERLYRNGVWQEGVIPSAGLNSAERAQTISFLERMTAFKRQHGRDGKRTFAIPIAYSSRDPALLELDRISMREWMLQHGYTAAPLHWYVDYACRDDFGTHSSRTSAWAAIHYFACRGGDGSDAGDVVLTAPEGNGWLVRRLGERLKDHLHAGAIAVRIGQPENNLCYADVYLVHEQRTIRLQAPQLICATPSFVLPHIWPDAPRRLQAAAKSIEHAPWLVANLHLKQMPQERHGAPLAWDNVLYESPGLGYVVATHQTIRTRPDATVLTYYHAFAGDQPAADRNKLLTTSRQDWAEKILRELERVHPDIRSLSTQFDVARYGHAMARPLTGAVWHGQRNALQEQIGGIQLAHADLSGFSLFEEANYHGVRCAERSLHALGLPITTLL